MNKTVFTVADDKKTLLMTRDFNVPQAKLWAAYTEKELFEQWFAPAGWEVTSKKFDFVEGGENVYVMKCVDESQGEWFGKTSAGKMVFSNISPKDTFEYVDFFTDEEGNVNKEMPSSKSTLELTENASGVTKLNIATEYATEDALNQVLAMGMEQGYDETLDKLEELLSNHK
jgi:uncharacterized protein YndB with AHSA1/START domain